MHAYRIKSKMYFSSILFHIYVSCVRLHFRAVLFQLLIHIVQIQEQGDGSQDNLTSFDAQKAHNIFTFMGTNQSMATFSFNFHCV
jgi:hypothetical protein